MSIADLNNNNGLLVNLFSNYTRYINETSDIILDMDTVLNKWTDTIRMFRPPSKYLTVLISMIILASYSQRSLEMFNFLNEMDRKNIDETASQLGKLPESKLYDLIQQIEKLNLKLMIDFSTELRRAKDLGVLKNDSFP
jgi:hypothetical protein